MSEMFDTNQIIDIKDEIFYGLNGRQTIYLVTGLGLGLAIFNTTLPIIIKTIIAVNIAIPTAIFTKTEVDQGIVSFVKFKWREVTKQNASISTLPKSKLSDVNRRRKEISALQV